MLRNILQSIERKLQQIFVRSSNLGQNNSSSRQDISSLAIGFLDTSTNLLVLTLPLIINIALVRNDLEDAIDQVLSK